MPILEIAIAASPLTQGDVLKGVDLFRTQIGETEAVHERSKAPFCMVLSRPCAVRHKAGILVAEISKYSQSVPKEVDTLLYVERFLRSLRNGGDSPDRFYLGEIPGEKGRFIANLDAVFTVCATEQSVLASKRIAALNRDFQRDLHVRLFNSVASLGFDDVDWLTDNDLDLVLTVGRRELSILGSQLADADAASARQAFGGQRSDESVRDKLRKQIDELEKSLAPYIKRRDERAAERA